ncbi:hypothetical protein [Nocardia anaemiae]|uniref:hypothetical protein n=1 Tax=Nocardia anaemiae TaxID=263910 RepID=UPI000A97545A|nr:hypothetical protein [Nocardia anaemiae]
MRSHGEGGLAEFAAIADPERRLRELLITVVQAVQPLAPSVHLSLLGDRNDPRGRDAVGRVNGARLELMTRTYRELGLLQSVRNIGRGSPTRPSSACYTWHKPMKIPRVLRDSLTKRPRSSCPHNSTRNNEPSTSGTTRQGCTTRG